MLTNIDLSNIRIASPCTASWDQMTGNDQMRYCSQCNLNVYNFSAMTAAQIERLIADSKGERLCARLYQRADGTILTRDCPVGLRARVRRVSRRLTAALAAAMSLAFTVKARPQQPDTARLGDVAVAATGFRLSVMNPLGTPVARAQVSVVDTTSHKTVATFITDDAGRFSLLRLAPGNYSIMVQSLGSESQIVPVSLQQNEVRQVTVKLEERHFTMGAVAIPQRPRDSQPK